MADWRTVRFDPTYEEPLDIEIIPLCDALQAAGFNTISSCCGHGQDWPRVWWNDLPSDAVCESLARFLLQRLSSLDYAPFTPWVWKEILMDSHRWMLEIHLHNQYFDTPPLEAFAMAREAILAVAGSIREWTIEDFIGRHFVGQKYNHDDSLSPTLPR